MKYSLVITDIDGVWTDGGMYYDERNVELKKFNTSDSVGVALLNQINLPLCIITSEATDIVRRRAKKLGIKHVALGANNKLAIATQLATDFGLSLNEVAFIGNDINDIPLLRAAGFSAVPDDAADYVKKEASLVLSKCGGDGVFREFVEYLLDQENMLEDAIKKYLRTIG